MKLFLGALSAIMILTAGSVSASFEMGQYEDTRNIYIEGDLTGTDKPTVDSVTLKIYDKTNGDIKYFSQVDVNENRIYRAKFKYIDDTQNLGVDVRYNGENLNDTLSIAKVTNKSEVVNAKIVLLNEDGKALELCDYETVGMSVHNYGEYTDINKNIKVHTYQSENTISNAEAAKAMIYVNNKYGDNVSYDVIVSFYDDNGRMLTVNKIDDENVEFDSYNDSYYLSEDVQIPQNAASVKGFVWQDGYSLIPFNNTSEDKLDNISMFVIGDSTYGCILSDYGHNDFPRAGVCAYLPDYFNSKYLKIENFAVSGWTTSAFLSEKTDESGNTSGAWYNVRNSMKAGDYLFITLGINDGGSIGWDAFKNNLDQIIKVAGERNVNVILGTAVGVYAASDRITESGTATGQLLVYNELKEKYPFITIMKISEEMAKKCQADPEIVGNGTYNQQQVTNNLIRKYHLNSDYFTEDWGLTEDEIKANSGYGVYTPGKVYDGCHVNARGADTYAKLIADMIASSDLKLKYYLK